MYILSLLSWFFFFFRQKTAYVSCSSDWSSDVCSSALLSLSLSLSSPPLSLSLFPKVPTPEIRAHSLYFDLSAYGVEALREQKTPATKPGFHLKIYGTFRHRYMALVCPANDTKMVRFLRHTVNSSVMAPSRPTVPVMPV